MEERFNDDRVVVFFHNYQPSYDAKVRQREKAYERSLRRVRQFNKKIEAENEKRTAEGESLLALRPMPSLSLPRPNTYIAILSSPEQETELPDCAMIVYSVKSDDVAKNIETVLKRLDFQYKLRPRHAPKTFPVYGIKGILPTLEVHEMQQLHGAIQKLCTGLNEGQSIDDLFPEHAQTLHSHIVLSLTRNEDLYLTIYPSKEYSERRIIGNELISWDVTSSRNPATSIEEYFKENRIKFWDNSFAFGQISRYEIRSPDRKSDEEYIAGLAVGIEETLKSIISQ